LIAALDVIDFRELVLDDFSFFAIGIALLLENNELIFENSLVSLLLLELVNHVLQSKS
jgi:hypothetical protein